MHLNLMLLPIILSNFIEHKQCYKLEVYERDDPEADCEMICTKSGGKSEYKEETQICKCFLDGNVDEIDVESMHKNANILGIILETVEQIERNRIERDINVKNMENHLESVHTLTTPVGLKTDKIVGQKKGWKTNIKSDILQQDQQRFLIQQIRENLNNLTVNHDQRSRQANIESIRAHLRQLSQSYMQESRAKNIVQQVKAKSFRFNPKVGAIHNDTEISDKGTQIPNPQGFEVITQDPTLIDEEVD